MQAKHAFDKFCATPAVADALLLHPKDTKVHDFYDTLMHDSDMEEWCKFTALVLTLPTGNAISEGGFSMVSFAKNKYRNTLRATLLEAQMLASANGPSVSQFAKHVSKPLAVAL